MERLIAANSVPQSSADTAPVSGTPQFATDGNPVTGVAATRWPAYQYNAIQEELMAIIASAGITPDRTDNSQVLKAIRAIMGDGGAPLTDTGSANAYEAANPVPLTILSLVHGTRQRVTIANTNSGHSTYAPDGLPAQPIVGMNLQPLQGAELLATQIAEFEYVVAAPVNNGNGAWLLLGCGGGASQLGAGSYGMPPAQFDDSTLLPTTAWVNQRGVAYPTTQQTINGSANGTYAIPVSGLNNMWHLLGTGPYTVTLPPLSSCPKGSTLYITNGASDLVTVQSASGDTPLVDPSLPPMQIMTGGALNIAIQETDEWRLIDGSSNLKYRPEFASSITSNGYQKLPSGMIIQWGTQQVNSGSSAVITNIVLPIAYKNQHLFSMVSFNGSNPPTNTNSTSAWPNSLSTIGIASVSAALTEGITWLSFGW